MRDFIDEPSTVIVPNRAHREPAVHDDSIDETGAVNPLPDVLIRLPDVSLMESSTFASGMQGATSAVRGALKTARAALWRRPKLVGAVAACFFVGLISLALLGGDDEPLPSEAPAWMGATPPETNPPAVDIGNTIELKGPQNAELGPAAPFDHDDSATPTSDEGEDHEQTADGGARPADTHSAANVPGHVSSDDDSPHLPKIKYPSLGTPNSVAIEEKSVSNAPTSIPDSKHDAANTSARIGRRERRQDAGIGKPITEPVADDPSASSAASEEHSDDGTAEGDSQTGIPQRIVDRLSMRNRTAFQGSDAQRTGETHHERTRSRLY